MSVNNFFEFLPTPLRVNKITQFISTGRYASLCFFTTGVAADSMAFQEYYLFGALLVFFTLLACVPEGFTFKLFFSPFRWLWLQLLTALSSLCFWAFRHFHFFREDYATDVPATRAEFWNSIQWFFAKNSRIFLYRAGVYCQYNERGVALFAALLYPIIFYLCGNTSSIDVLQPVTDLIWYYWCLNGTLHPWSWFEAFFFDWEFSKGGLDTSWPVWSVLFDRECLNEVFDSSVFSTHNVVGRSWRWAANSVFQSELKDYLLHVPNDRYWADSTQSYHLYPQQSKFYAASVVYPVSESSPLNYVFSPFQQSRVEGELWQYQVYNDGQPAFPQLKVCGKAKSSMDLFSFGESQHDQSAAISSGQNQIHDFVWNGFSEVTASSGENGWLSAHAWSNSWGTDVAWVTPSVDAHTDFFNFFSSLFFLPRFSSADLVSDLGLVEQTVTGQFDTFHPLLFFSNLFLVQQGEFLSEMTRAQRILEVIFAGELARWYSDRSVFLAENDAQAEINCIRSITDPALSQMQRLYYKFFTLDYSTLNVYFGPSLGFPTARYLRAWPQPNSALFQEICDHINMSAWFVNYQDQRFHEEGRHRLSHERLLPSRMLNEEFAMIGNQWFFVPEIPLVTISGPQVMPHEVSQLVRPLSNDAGISAVIEQRNLSRDELPVVFDDFVSLPWYFEGGLLVKSQDPMIFFSNWFATMPVKNLFLQTLVPSALPELRETLACYASALFADPFGTLKVFADATALCCVKELNLPGADAKFLGKLFFEYICLRTDLLVKYPAAWPNTVNFGESFFFFSVEEVTFLLAWFNSVTDVTRLSDPEYILDRCTLGLDFLRLRSPDLNFCFRSALCPSPIVAFDPAAIWGDWAQFFSGTLTGNSVGENQHLRVKGIFFIPHGSQTVRAPPYVLGGELRLLRWLDLNIDLDRMRQISPEYYWRFSQSWAVLWSLPWPKCQFLIANGAVFSESVVGGGTYEHVAYNWLLERLSKLVQSDAVLIDSGARFNLPAALISAAEAELSKIGSGVKLARYLDGVLADTSVDEYARMADIYAGILEDSKNGTFGLVAGASSVQTSRNEPRAVNDMLAELLDNELAAPGGPRDEPRAVNDMLAEFLDNELAAPGGPRVELTEYLENVLASTTEEEYIRTAGIYAKMSEELKNSTFGRAAGASSTATPRDESCAIDTMISDFSNFLDVRYQLANREITRDLPAIQEIDESLLQSTESLDSSEENRFMRERRYDAAPPVFDDISGFDVKGIAAADVVIEKMRAGAADVLRSAQAWGSVLSTPPDASVPAIPEVKDNFSEMYALAQRAEARMRANKFRFVERNSPADMIDQEFSALQDEVARDMHREARDAEDVAVAAEYEAGLLAQRAEARDAKDAAVAADGWSKNANEDFDSLYPPLSDILAGTYGSESSGGGVNVRSSQETATHAVRKGVVTTLPYVSFTREFRESTLRLHTDWHLDFLGGECIPFDLSPSIREKFLEIRELASRAVTREEGRQRISHEYLFVSPDVCFAYLDRVYDVLIDMIRRLPEEEARAGRSGLTTEQWAAFYQRLYLVAFVARSAASRNEFPDFGRINIEQFYCTLLRFIQDDYTTRVGKRYPLRDVVDDERAHWTNDVRGHWTQAVQSFYNHGRQLVKSMLPKFPSQVIPIEPELGAFISGRLTREISADFTALVDGTYTKILGDFTPPPPPPKPKPIPVVDYVGENEKRRVTDELSCFFGTYGSLFKDPVLTLEAFARSVVAIYIAQPEHHFCGDSSLLGTLVFYHLSSVFGIVDERGVLPQPRGSCAVLESPFITNEHLFLAPVLDMIDFSRVGSVTYIMDHIFIGLLVSVNVRSEMLADKTSELLTVLRERIDTVGAEGWSKQFIFPVADKLEVYWFSGTGWVFFENPFLAPLSRPDATLRFLDRLDGFGREDLWVNWHAEIVKMADLSDKAYRSYVFDTLHTHPRAADYSVISLENGVRSVMWRNPEFFRFNHILGSLTDGRAFLNARSSVSRDYSMITIERLAFQPFAFWNRSAVLDRAERCCSLFECFRENIVGRKNFNVSRAGLAQQLQPTANDSHYWMSEAMQECLPAHGVRSLLSVNEISLRTRAAFSLACWQAKFACRIPVGMKFWIESLWRPAETSERGFVAAAFRLIYNFFKVPVIANLEIGLFKAVVNSVGWCVNVQREVAFDLFQLVRAAAFPAWHTRRDFIRLSLHMVKLLPELVNFTYVSDYFLTTATPVPRSRGVKFTRLLRKFFVELTNNNLFFEKKIKIKITSKALPRVSSFDFIDSFDLRNCGSAGVFSRASLDAPLLDFDSEANFQQQDASASLKKRYKKIVRNVKSSYLFHSLLNTRWDFHRLADWAAGGSLPAGYSPQMNLTQNWFVPLFSNRTSYDRSFVYLEDVLFGDLKRSKFNVFWRLYVTNAEVSNAETQENGFFTTDIPEKQKFLPGQLAKSSRFESTAPRSSMFKFFFSHRSKIAFDQYYHYCQTPIRLSPDIWSILFDKSPAGLVKNRWNYFAYRRNFAFWYPSYSTSTVVGAIFKF